MSTDAPESLDYGRARDHAADEIERCRRRWHDTRTRVDAAKYELMAAVRAQILAELDYRQAVSAYEAVR